MAQICHYLNIDGAFLRHSHDLLDHKKK